MEINQIKNYHIHIYYNELTIELAKKIAQEAAEKFGLSLGRFHEKNVGPHPRWSVQLLVPTNMFSNALSWICLHRQGLTIFTHPNTGYDLEDHRDHAIWMGECLELNLANFK
jgi:aromatic ring-cleaving dioxygenase